MDAYFRLKWSIELEQKKIMFTVLISDQVDKKMHYYPSSSLSILRRISSPELCLTSSFLSEFYPFLILHFCND